MLLTWNPFERRNLENTVPYTPRHTHTHLISPNYISRKCDNVRLMVRIGALSSPLPNVFAAPMNDQCWVALKTCQVPRTLNDLAILGNAFMRQFWEVSIDIYWHCTNLALRSTLRLWSKELPGSVAEATVGRPILVATWMSWQIMASRDIVIPCNSLHSLHTSRKWEEVNCREDIWSEWHLPLTVFQWKLLLPILHARQHQRGLWRTPNSQPAVPCHQVKWCQTWTNSMWPNEKNVTTCDKPLWNVEQNLTNILSKEETW